MRRTGAAALIGWSTTVCILVLPLTAGCGETGNAIHENPISSDSYTWAYYDGPTRYTTSQEIALIWMDGDGPGPVEWVNRTTGYTGCAEKMIGERDGYLGPYTESRWVARVPLAWGENSILVWKYEITVIRDTYDSHGGGHYYSDGDYHYYFDGKNHYYWKIP